jgi:OOP family OmpA-OmpF porin
MRKLFVSIFAVSLLAGCASEDVWDVDKVRAMNGVDDEFHQQLKYEYTELAAAERAEGDWDDTVVFLERAKAAAAGMEAAPEAEGFRDIDDEWVEEVYKSRVRLNAVLGNDEAVAKRPREAALALSGFDCWMQEIEENHQSEDIAACRAQFEAAMSVIENDGCGPNRFIVYFDFNKSNLTDEAKMIANNAIRHYKSVMNKKPTVVIAGHADTVGTKAYNSGLSKRRADAVKAYLASQGIDVKGVIVEYYGETKPAVLTPDETMEPRNRRATVDVK